jgi:uncharacterized damage-inducible protein DinB
MMSRSEVWLRGPLPDVPPLLQPVAHSLLQCREEVAECLPGLTAEQLAARPGGAASIAYHVRHAIGSLDRLLTYARGRQLSDEQWAHLKAERNADGASADELVAAFDAAIAHALEQVRDTGEATLIEPRVVGRKQLPSTVIGLLFHAAEHTQRHVGQLVTTAKLLRAEPHA